MSNPTTKFHPILFSTPMVQAILEGKKTQTRRAVKPKYRNTDLVMKEFNSGRTKSLVEIQNDTPPPRKNDDGSTTHSVKAYHQVQSNYHVGDVLWVRETWQIRDSRKPKEFFYKANDEMTCAPWKPSIFMPKEACRIFLKVKSVRIERLMDISEEDAQKEGVKILPNGSYRNYHEEEIEQNYMYTKEAKASFKTLWESIYSIGRWEFNPYVFVYEFEKIEKPLDFVV